ncbi:MAG: hypothetical protein EXS05_04135 [Planctomycetaceae bacterium]|nr:hypothetical protein [Planctomycetaceae bacterium]
MSYRLVALLVIGLLSTILPGARADEVRPAAVALPTEPDPDDSQDLLFLASDRPVFIRLHLRVDGQSFRAAWRDFAAKMFREIDFNDDGLLAGDEWVGIPSPDMLVDGNPRGARGGGGEIIDQAPRDGLITLDEFTDYLTTVGSRPLSLQAVGAGERPGGGFVAPGGGIHVSSQLFERLDTDGDTRLSPDEFNAAPRVLARIDFDDDGTFSRLELLPGIYGGASFTPLAEQRIVRPAQFVDLGPGEPAEAIARRLLDHYDRPPLLADGNPAAAIGNDRLSRDEVHFSEELFAKLDLNGDGELEFNEIPHVARYPVPAIEWTIRIGRRGPSEAAVEIVSLDPALPVDVRPTGDGQVTFLIAATQLELSAEFSSASPRLREFYSQQFKAVDGDNNKYLDKAETQRNFFFNQIFVSMDEDGDGKLFESEMVRYIGRREAAAGSRSVMSVADGGRNLFEILDTNRDGRLGKRELLAAAKRLDVWDANKDGRLSEGEVPAHFRLSFGPAQPNLPGLQFVVNQRIPAPGGVQRGASDGPAWFQRMDKNHDGDISRREFLGTRESFDKLDVNRDGAIDAAEAGAP